MSNIKEAIKEIKSKVPYLNFGGCGIFAYEFSKRLSKLGIKHKIVILDNEPIEPKKWVLNNIESASSTQLRQTSFAHCGIKINDTIIDGYNYTDITSKWIQYNKRDTYSRKEMRLALKYGVWNTLYNTDYNKLLKQIIQKLTEL